MGFGNFLCPAPCGSGLQVAIGETTFDGLPSLMSQPGAIMDYYSLMWVTLQRARTAREAIQLMDNLTQTYGYVKCAACVQTCMCTAPPSWGPTRGLARVSPSLLRCLTSQVACAQPSPYCPPLAQSPLHNIRRGLTPSHLARMTPTCVRPPGVPIE